jgi:hypothetical protein
VTEGAQHECTTAFGKTRGCLIDSGCPDRIDPGGPAWKVQARTGDVIQWIGSRGPYPPFDQLQPIVMSSSKGEKLRFVYRQQTVDRLQFHNQSSIHHDIHSISAFELHRLIGNRQRHLAPEFDACGAKFVAQAFFIG